MTAVAHWTRWCAAVMGLLLLAPSLVAAQDVTLQASAGFAGLVRPGRWAPVRIDLSASRALNGELIVDWGTARVRRAVALDAGQDRHFELYVRTVDPRDVITIRLVIDETTRAETQVPVRVVAYEASNPPLVVCGQQAAASDSDCLATVAVPSLPLSWRGFDAADDVRLSPSEVQALTPQQRLAFHLAAAQSRLFNLGVGRPTLGSIPTDLRATRRALILLGGYGILFIALLWMVRWRRRSLTLAAIAVCGVAGSIAVGAAGHTGSGAAVVVHHAASIDQYEGVGRAVLTLRASAEFPAFDTYSLRSELDDAVILPQGRSASETAQLDATGFPVLTGRFGLGKTAPFILEGSASPVLLRVSRSGQNVSVTNVSGQHMTDCGFSTSSSDVRVDLSPGGSASGVTNGDEADPTFSCTLENSPWGVSERRRPVIMNGRAVIVVHLSPGPDNAAAASDR